MDIQKPREKLKKLLKLTCLSQPEGLYVLIELEGLIQPEDRHVVGDDLGVVALVHPHGAHLRHSRLYIDLFCRAGRFPL